MLYELKWNGDKKVGYIVNDIYPRGYIFDDASLKPLVGFDYTDLFYSELAEVFFLVVNDEKVNLTIDQIEVVSSVLRTWTDTRYMKEEQELEVIKRLRITELTNNFDTNISEFIGGATTFEVASWDKQEAEAAAWLIENTTATPFLDSILAARNMNADVAETKDELVTKIVFKASSYQENFGARLGKLHADIKAITLATTKEELGFGYIPVFEIIEPINPQ